MQRRVMAAMATVWAMACGLSLEPVVVGADDAPDGAPTASSSGAAEATLREVFDGDCGDEELAGCAPDHTVCEGVEPHGGGVRGPLQRAAWLWHDDWRLGSESARLLLELGEMAPGTALLVALGAPTELHEPPLDQRSACTWLREQARGGPVLALQRFDAGAPWLRWVTDCAELLQVPSSVAARGEERLQVQIDFVRAPAGRTLGRAVFAHNTPIVAQGAPEIAAPGWEPSDRPSLLLVGWQDDATLTVRRAAMRCLRPASSR